MNNNASLLIYLNELMYRCNTLSKGFIFLLMDDEYIFDNYSGIKYPKNLINELIKEFGYSEITKDKQEYFFKHLYLFFNHNSNFTINDKHRCILSSISTYVNNPLDYLIKLLNSHFNNPNVIIKAIKNKTFYKSYLSQCKIINKHLNNEEYYKQVKKQSFPNELNYLYNKIVDTLKENKKINFESAVNIICDIYSVEHESKTELKTVKSLDESNIIFTENKSDKKQEEINKLNKKEDKDLHITGSEFDEILKNFFNPKESYIDSVYDKYKILSEKMSYDSKDCRSIKSILYLATYLLKNKKNKDFKPAEYMRKIINSDIGWAVGDENNKEPSFYGDSDLSKFIYGYYSYMTGKENPYTDLIDNKIIKQMDYNAIMINKFFKENGLANIGYTNENLKEVYNLLVNFREIVKVIDAPISLSGTYDNFISGIISSILNSAATMLDFSVSSIVKSLFYVEIIPINKKKYSIANLYNYISFIKLILENVGEYKTIDYIDREEFINQAYDILGINKESLKRIGYLAYDREMIEYNENYGKIAILLDSDKLFKNNNDINFMLRRDMKLLYSLIQFAVQKKSVLTGDISFEDKFSFGDEFALNDILNYLTDTEIYYIFKIYNINIWTLDDKLGAITNKDIFDFNNELLFIDAVYDHHNTDFYNVYISKSPNKLYKEMKEYDFLNTNYKKFISSMFNYYKKVLKYNKKQLDNIIFESNDISEIDDFFVRFIPSITELLKLFGQNTNSIQEIAKFLDTFLTFITNKLFRNLFINIKIDIKNFIKKYTPKDFEYKTNTNNTTSLTIDFDFGNSKFMQAVDLIIDLIEKGNFNLFSIQSCFDEASAVDGIYDPMEYDDLIFNHGHNSISRNEFFDDTNNSFDKTYIGTIEKEKNNNKYNNSTENQVPKDKTKETIVDHSYTDNKKIYYDKGNIFIEKNDGTIITVVSKNDKNLDNISVIEYPNIVDKILSQNEYQQLVEIRDYIDNITNQELISLNKQLSKEKEKLKIEMNKNIPNYNVTKNINKNIQKLTSAINDVKKENRIMTTEEQTVVIKDFEQNTSQSNNTYSTLDEFFKNKKEILKEVNNIVINNEVILTNYQITELLK